MKKLLIPILIVITITINFGFKSIEGPEKFVQFYVSGIENREKADELNEYLKSKDGIKMSRVDASIKVCYVIFKSGTEYTEKDVTEWLAEKGYTHSCFYSGEFGKDPFKKLTPEECGTK